MNVQVEWNFPRHYQVQVLPEKPLIMPTRSFVFPKDVEEADRNALLLEVRPAEAEPWTGIFALGFDSTSVIHGVFSCPNPKWLCAISGGYAYLANTENPLQNIHLPARPVVQARAYRDLGLLLFCDFTTITAVGREGIAWRTPALTWEGLSLGEFSGTILRGSGWNAITDREVPFAVDLTNGKCEGGCSPIASGENPTGRRGR